MGDITLERTAELLESEIEEGLFTRGAQVAVNLAGVGQATLALGDDGRGGQVEDDTVFRVYCTIKPVTVLAIARLVDDGTLELDEPLRERLPMYRVLDDGSVTLRRVLNHTAGLHRPMAIELELMPPPKRLEHVRQIPRPANFTVGVDAAYSEWFGWHILGQLLEAVTGEPLHEHLRRVVIDPLGMTDTWIGMTKDEYREVLPRLGVNHDLRSMQSYPLLLERGERMCTEVNPAHGGYSTATDLCRLYAAIVEQLEHGDVDALPSPEVLEEFTSAARPSIYDQVLDRVCEHGLGFMTSLSEHAFGRHCSPRSFGHSGNVGSSFAWADPEYGLAAAVVFNGIVDPDSAFLRRPSVVRAIVADLGLDQPPPAEPEADDGGADAERPKRRWFRRNG
jgi:CubicO group peptidase (beta-lactamase class C family)